MPKTISAPTPWDNPGIPPSDAAALAQEQAAADAAAQAAEIAAQAASSTPTPSTDLQVAPATDAAHGATEIADEVTVTVTAPKPFTLNLSHDLRVEYKAGVQEMPLAHATHWWAKAHGVEVYVKK